MYLLGIKMFNYLLYGVLIFVEREMKMFIIICVVFLIFGVF